MPAVYSAPELFVDTVTDQVTVAYNPYIAGPSLTLMGQPEQRIFQALQSGQHDENALKQQFSADYPSTFVETVLNNFCDKGIAYRDTPPEPPVVNDEAPLTHLAFWFHFTNQCNLRCTYCFVGKTNEYIPLDTGLGYLNQLMDKLAQYPDIKSIRVTYAGGEPLVQFDNLTTFHHHIKQACEQMGRHYKATVITNGTLLTNDIADWLKQENVDIQITLDGLEATHNLTRPYVNGAGSFNKVCDAIQLALSKELALNAHVVVSTQNIDEVPALIAYFAEHTIRFDLSLAGDNEYFTQDERWDSPTLIAKYHRILQACIQHFPDRSILADSLGGVSLLKPRTRFCGAGNNYFSLNHKGELSPCQRSEMLSYGSIEAENVLEAVLSRQANTSFNTVGYKKSECAACMWRFSCAGYCAAITYDAYNTTDKASPLCGFYKAILPRALKLEAQRILNQLNPADVEFEFTG